jgi:hypothetical protein
LNGLNLEHLAEALGLDLPEFKSDDGSERFQCVRAFFVKAADLWNDDKRPYYCVAFRLQSPGGRDFKLFGPETESFASEDVPDGWDLLHRPASSIGPTSAALDISRPSEPSILHIYNVPAKNTIQLWNADADRYHDALTRVSGGQPVSFLPRFAAGKGDPVPGSRWVMTYQTTALLRNFSDADKYPDDAAFATPHAGIVNASVSIAPLSLHLSDRPSVAGRPKLPAAQLPRVQDVGGQAVQLDFDPAATVGRRNNAAEIEELDQAELVYGIAMNCGSAIGSRPSAGSEGVARMGSLDIAFGARQPGSTDQSWLIVRHDGTSRIHVDAFFAVADVRPGGQDDPAGEEYVPDNSVVLGLTPVRFLSCFAQTRPRRPKPPRPTQK